MTFLVQPAATWQPPNRTALKACVERPPQKRASWEDLAAEERWEEAIIEFLKANWRGKVLLWHVINRVVAESQPECRWQVREMTTAALRAMTGLIRQKRVMRFHRRWVAALELPFETVPIDSIPLTSGTGT